MSGGPVKRKGDIMSSDKPDPFLIDEDNPELAEEELAKARPAKEIFEELGLPMPRRPRGRPRSETPKTQVTLRLDADIIRHFRESGKGWQTRLNDTLRQVIDGQD